MNKFDEFRDLHHQATPLLIGNVWNAKSAQVFEQNGFKALATSSAAVARSMGYDDGENISFDELFFMVERILSVVKIPLSVDIESGYSDDVEGVFSNIKKLCEAGVVGINLEDSNPHEKRLVPVNEFAQKISYLKDQMKQQGIELFINARTDAYLLKESSPLEKSLERVAAYEKAGADGVFVAFAKDEADIKKLTASTKLPVNVVCYPGLPSFDVLEKAGVKRISMGNYSFSATYAHLDSMIKNIVTQGSFDAFTGR